MAKGFLDGCIWQAQSEGLGDFAFTEALESFFSPTEAGAVDGTTYNYTAYKGASREAGWGVWNESTGTLTRNPVISTNSNGPVNFPDPPVVIMGGPLAGDMPETELLSRIDITADGPLPDLEVTVDFAKYDYIEVRATNVRADLSNLEANDGMIALYFDVIGPGPSTILSGKDDGTHIGFSHKGDHDGADIIEERAPYLCARIALDGETLTVHRDANGYEVYISGSLDDRLDEPATARSYNYGSNPTDVTLRFFALFNDDSAGDFGADQQLVNGVVTVLGHRKV